MKIFNQLPKETKERIFRQVATEKGLPVFAVEKDWWVVQVLRIVFSTATANAIMCEEMIYGDKLSWENLYSRIRALQVDFNSQGWKVNI